MSLSYPVARHQLGNGLRVVVSEDPHAPTAAVRLLYGAGSRHEPPGRPGLANLAARLVSQDWPSTEPGSRAAPLHACGAAFGSAAGTDTAEYHAHLPAGAVELALWLEAARMAAVPGALTRELLDAERAAIAREQRRRRAAPYTSTGPRLLALVYPSGHPYCRPAAGTPADLDAVTLDDVTGFLRDFYTPGNAVLAVAGDVTAGQVLDAAERYFGPLPAGPRPPRAPAQVLDPAAGQARDDALETAPGAVTALGFRLPPARAGDPEALACDLALRILAGGPLSRARQALVTALQAARDVTAQTRLRVGGNSLGTITVHAAPGAPADVTEKVLMNELDALAADGPAEEELACARAVAERETLARLSARPGRAAVLARLEAAFGDPGLVNSLPGLVTAVTPGQVQEAAARWLRPGCAAVVTTRPAVVPPEE